MWRSRARTGRPGRVATTIGQAACRVNVLPRRSVCPGLPRPRRSYADCRPPSEPWVHESTITFPEGVSGKCGVAQAGSTRSGRAASEGRLGRRPRGDRVAPTGSLGEPECTTKRWRGRPQSVTRSRRRFGGVAVSLSSKTQVGRQQPYPERHNGPVAAGNAAGMPRAAKVVRRTHTLPPTSSALTSTSRSRARTAAYFFARNSGIWVS